jgi:hypothetical protein
MILGVDLGRRSVSGLDVVDERISFPGTGQQRRFLERMAAGLASIG